MITLQMQNTINSAVQSQHELLLVMGTGGRGGGGGLEYIEYIKPGMAGCFLARVETVTGAEALISQGGLGDSTPSAPASTPALPGLFSKGLGLPTDPGA